jgi:hypothetical protein
MKVYLTGIRAAQAAEHVLYVAPAGHLENTEMPSEWVTEKNEPITMSVVFHHGAAEVPSNLGAYLVKFGFASKTRLIIPDGIKAVA